MDEIAKYVFDQYEKGKLSYKELIHALEQIVNATATANGYVDQHGLPLNIVVE